MNRGLVCLLLLVSLSLFSSSGAAVVWHVDASMGQSGDGQNWETAFTVIQEGIDAASHGDTVIVAPGIYIENIHFAGKNITLTSTDPFDPGVVEATVIDGGQAGPTVSFAGTEDDTCLLSGFTIRNGWSPENGGGILGGSHVEKTRAGIEHNIITGNFAWRSGGGISSCDGVIENNRIEGNEALAAGGGVYWCGGLIANNVIVGNLAGYGGGAFACYGTIQGCTIAGNWADIKGGGLEDCQGWIQNNVISGNYAESGGGAAGCLAMFQGNTIVGNHTTFGGGLYDCSGTIVNCIIWWNMATEGPQLEGCAAPRYSCVQGWESGGAGNTASDPRFLSLGGPDHNLDTWEDNDLRLSPDSPCIDAGINGYWAGWPTADRDANTRVVNGTVDMGCYELGSSPDADGDLLSDSEEQSLGTDAFNLDTDGDGLADGIEVLRGTDPQMPNEPGILTVPVDLPTIQDAVAVSRDGETVIVQPGRYVDNIHLLGKNIILRSVDPSDLEVVTNTVLDGAESGPVVAVSRAHGLGCVVAGLTLSGGKAKLGGGIYGGPWEMKARVVIENNIIAGNGARDGGGAFACEGLIQGNVFVDNTARAGAALWSCNGAIRNNVITANTANDWGAGPGHCQGEILGNILVGNRALSAGGGGAIALKGLISNNLVVGNRADFRGGGLSGCEGTITNNTIARNLSGYYGGGLSGCSGQIVNCIVWGNTAPEGAQLYQSTAPSYSCIQGWPGGGPGNMAEDPVFLGYPLHAGEWTAQPTYESMTFKSSFENAAASWEPGALAGLFVNPNTEQPLQFVITGNTDNTVTVWGNATQITQAGGAYEIYDYHLHPSSPCVDAGKIVDHIGSFDLEGNPRSVNSRPNIGWEGQISYLEREDHGSITIMWKAVIDMGPYECQVSVPTPETFTVQMREAMEHGDWIDVFTGNVGTWTHEQPPGRQRFYRVRMD